jgi:mannose-1-phosphate guanylyltransferase
MYELFAAEKNNFNTAEEKHALERIYPLCASISIDYAIMEKANNVFVIPAEFGWSDLGTWNSAYTNLEKDEKTGNAVTSENVITFDTFNSMVSSSNDKLLVLQGLEDFIIVDTDDVLLICKKENEQQVKEFLSEVKKKKGDKYI